MKIEIDVPQRIIDIIGKPELERMLTDLMQFIPLIEKLVLQATGQEAIELEPI